MWAVLKKEFKTYFLSPIGYVFIGIFLAMFSILFYITTIYQGMTTFQYVFYYSAIYNIHSSIINNENVCRRKKKWNRATANDIT